MQRAMIDLTTWTGRVFGALLGYMAADWAGAVAGFIIGFWLDRRRKQLVAGHNDTEARMGDAGHTNAGHAQAAFFETSFAVMGAVCKVDGQISSAEIRAAETFMARIGITGVARQQAIDAFTRGKQPEFDLDAAVAQFRQAARWQPLLLRLFMEIQLRAAFADGRITTAERRVLLRIARQLGLSPRDFARLEQVLGAAPAPTSGIEALPAAYRMLEVSPKATDAEVKRAYRRLMSQYHPDKLAARGLPETMLQVAGEKTQQIRAAYDTIRKVRGM